MSTPKSPTGTPNPVLLGVGCIAAALVMRWIDATTPQLLGVLIVVVFVWGVYLESVLRRIEARLAQLDRE